MTYNISNPRCNPRKLTKAQKKAINRASQVCRQTPIKKGGLGNGYTSSYTRFMVEFQAGKDKTPKNFESWQKQKPTGIDESGEITWSARQKLPKVSQTAGLKRIPEKERAEIAAKARRQNSDYSIAETHYEKSTENTKEEKHKVDFASN